MKDEIIKTLEEGLDIFVVCQKDLDILIGKELLEYSKKKVCFYFNDIEIVIDNNQDGILDENENSLHYFWRLENLNKADKIIHRFKQKLEEFSENLEQSQG